MKKWVVRLYASLPRRISKWGVRLLKPTHLVGVVGVVFNDRGDVLALKHTYHTPAWRLPGGIKEGRESPEDTIKREVYEEARCTVIPIQVVDARQLEHSFDVAILALLEREHPFVKNEETCERAWLGGDSLNRLPSVHREFILRAQQWFSNQSQSQKEEKQ